MSRFAPFQQRRRAESRRKETYRTGQCAVVRPTRVRDLSPPPHLISRRSAFSKGMPPPPPPLTCTLHTYLPDPVPLMDT